MRFLHRRRDQALQQLLGARVDDGEADAPQPRAHDVHAEQAGHEPVNVARAYGLHGLLDRAERVRAPRGALQRCVNREPGHLAFGPRFIVAVRRRRAGHDHHRRAAVA